MFCESLFSSVASCDRFAGAVNVAAGVCCGFDDGDGRSANNVSATAAFTTLRLISFAGGSRRIGLEAFSGSGRSLNKSIDRVFYYYEVNKEGGDKLIYGT